MAAAATYAAGRGLVALAVIDRQTGSYVDNGANAHTPMGSASVVKVLIADELLYRDAQGEIELGLAELAQMEIMIMDSNDSAASSLYSKFGGSGGCQAGLDVHSAGIRNVHSTAVLGPDNRYVTVTLTSYDESLPYSYGQERATEVARLMLSELAL